MKIPTLKLDSILSKISNSSFLQKVKLVSKTYEITVNNDNYEDTEPEGSETDEDGTSSEEDQDESTWPRVMSEYKIRQLMHVIYYSLYIFFNLQIAYIN